MNFIFAKHFEEYVRKNDSAKLRIALYISILYFFLTFAVLLPIKTYIDKQLLHNQVHYEKSTIMIVLFGLLTTITYVVYHIYIKNGYINKLSDRFKTKSINKAILYLIIIIAPVTLLLLAGTITVFFTGGAIWGNNINGLLE